MKKRLTFPWWLAVSNIVVRVQCHGDHTFESNLGVERTINSFSFMV